MKPSGEVIFGKKATQETWSPRKGSNKEGTRQGGAPSTLVEASCPSRTASYFPIFLNIPKRRKIVIRTVLESVYLLYHVPIPFRSLKRSGKCPLCIPSGLRFQ